MTVHQLFCILHSLPLAIQVEIRFSDDSSKGVKISPFTCAHYLMFLCYHELRRYEERDNALRLLIDTIDSLEQLENRRYHSFNITGHCLLLAGHTFHACVMFVRSYLLTQMNKPYDKYNSAIHYLESVPWSELASI